VSLYNPHIATMEADPTKAYNQNDATGFIRLNACDPAMRDRGQGAEKVIVAHHHYDGTA
jgi:argininosuccinate synthase